MRAIQRPLIEDVGLIPANSAVTVPVIASGGAGTPEHLRDGFTEGKASAVLLAGILHDGLTTVGALKAELAGWGIPVRPVAAALERTP